MAHQTRKLLSMEELRTVKGIPYSRAHLHRLIKAGQFPKPIKLGGGGRNAFVESEIDAHVETRIAQREAA